MSLLPTLRDALIIASIGVSLGSSATAGRPQNATKKEPAMTTATSSTTPAPRQITFNGVPATERDLQILARFEAVWGVQVPSGAYWYDNASGAGGYWGGPTRGFLGAGLGLGGMQVPASASGGGDGSLTGVFINGRELHPLDVQGLAMLLGQAPVRGFWWVDAFGNFGPQGYGMMGNLHQIIAQRSKSQGGGSYYRSDSSKGSSTFVGRGCAAVTQRLRASDADSSYSYYVGCD